MSFLINPFFFAAAGGGGGTTPTTWNPSDKTNTTLSGSDLIASTAAGGGVRGVAGKATGKFYCEYTYTTINTNSINTGISLISGALNGTSNTGISFIARTTGGITVNGSGSASALGIIAQSSVIGMAVDFGADLLWMRVAPSGDWNGSPTANPATGAGGVDISSISTGPLYPLMRGDGGDVITANFGASGFTGTVPSGFTSGWLGPP